MVISISPILWKEALSKKDPFCNKIIKTVLNMVELGRHELLFENTIDINELISADEFKSYTKTIKETVKHSFYKKESKKVVRITKEEFIDKTKLTKYKDFFDGKKIVTENKDKIFEYIDISLVKTYLDSPLYIVVENKDSDGKFIRNIYNYFSQNKFEKMEKDNKIQIIHGSGGNVKLSIEAFTNPCRLLGIVDSDKKYPDDSIGQKKDKQELIKICNERGFHLIILERREIENYIPDKAIKKWKPKSGSKISEINQYFLLNEKQKSYFDIKHGLKIKDFKEPKVRELYNNIYEIYKEIDLNKCEDKQILEKEIIKGFGPDTYNAFDEICVCSREDFAYSQTELSDVVQKIIEMT